MTDLGELTDEQQAVLAEMAAQYLANRPAPTPLHQIRDRCRILLSQLNTIENRHAPPVRARLGRASKERQRLVDATPKLVSYERAFHPMAIGMAQGVESRVAAELSDVERRAEAVRAQLDQLAADQLRFDEEWRRCQPQHDKAREKLLKRFVSDADSAVKAAQKSAQKAEEPAALRAAADELEAAQNRLSGAQRRLAEFGRAGVRDWR